MSFISIIIPTYKKHANCLSKALKSVINQSFQNWEAIVVDNQPINETRKIISDYSDARIKYLTISNNGIVANSRNTGILLAKGKIWDIAYNTYELNYKLKKLLDYRNNNKIKINKLAKWYRDQFFVRPTNKKILKMLNFNNP